MATTDNTKRLDEVFTDTSTYTQACTVVRDLSLKPAGRRNKARTFTPETIQKIQEEVERRGTSKANVIVEEIPDGFINIKEAAELYVLSVNQVWGLIHVADIEPAAHFRRAVRGKKTAYYNHQTLTDLVRHVKNFKKERANERV